MWYSLFQVEEFLSQISPPNVRLYDNAVLVVWKWKSLVTTPTVNQDAKSFITEEGEEKIEEDKFDMESRDGRNEEPKEDSGSPFVFKCIGAVRDVNSQTSLRTCRDRMANGWTVPVTMEHEPTNIKDVKAIAFKCEIDGKWHRIGYVVSEILEEVHAAISADQIVSVRFAWVKYVTDWTRSGPGYFAGIGVTKKGQWEAKVLRYKSTR